LLQGAGGYPPPPQVIISKRLAANRRRIWVWLAFSRILTFAAIVLQENGEKIYLNKKNEEAA
jgi:hypothetical protein